MNFKQLPKNGETNNTVSTYKRFIRKLNSFLLYRFTYNMLSSHCNDGLHKQDLYIHAIFDKILFYEY